MPHASRLLGRTQGRAPEDAVARDAPVLIGGESRTPDGVTPFPAVDADGDAVREALSRNGVQFMSIADLQGLFSADVGTENAVAPAALTGLGLVGRATTALLALGNGDFAALNFDLSGRLRVLESAGQLAFTRSDKDVDFTGAIADGDHATANLTGLASSLGVIESVTLLAEDNVGWEVHFWATDGFDNLDLDLDSWIDRVVFQAADGVTIGNATATTRRYAASDLRIPYEDRNATTELHVSLVPRGGAKAAGAAGEVVLEVGFRAQI